MQIVKARFRNREEFLGAYDRARPAGGLFIPTTQPLEAGTGVVVELHCDGLPNKVLIKARVQSWRPALPRLRVRAGATVEFDPEEREKCEFIIGTLGGDIPPPPKRKHARIPVAVPVHFRVVETAHELAGDLVEISAGGALLHTDAPPPLGSELVLSLMPPGGAVPMEILGKVTYLTPQRAAGVKFTFRDGGGARRLRELIRRLRVA